MGFGMSALGGEADVIGTKADIAARRSVSYAKMPVMTPNANTPNVRMRCSGRLRAVEADRKGGGGASVEGMTRRGYGSIARKPASTSRDDHSSSNPLEKKSDEAPEAYYRLREFPAKIRLWTSVDNGHGA